MANNPVDSPQDYVILGGERAPVICEVQGAQLKRTLKQIRPYAVSGAIVQYLGDELCEFKIVFRLYTSADWAAWQAFAAGTIYKAPARRGGAVNSGALDIYHPLLESLGIRAVIVKTIGQPEQQDLGDWSITVEFLEFRKPKPVLVKPDAPRATPADPVDSAEVKIGQLLEQTRRLAEGP
jgi:hypothetical protein